MKKLMLGLVIGAVASLGVGHAQNIVSNPGFETGDFTDYTTQAAPEGTLFGITSNPHSGSYAAEFGAVGDDLDYISQSLPTTIGTTYEISFYLEAVNPNANEFVANIGGTLESTSSGTTDYGAPNYISGGDTFEDIVDQAFDYTEFTSSFTATSSSTNLIFGSLNVPSYDYLDDIFVGVGVPEPSSWAMMLGGLGWLAVWRLRKAKA